MAQSKKIGFPAGMLGEDPIRFDVLAEASPSFVAIGKPADILLDSYLGSPKEKSVMLAMRETPDKPEFKRLGINSPYAVNQLDFEISGAAIIACDKDTANEVACFAQVRQKGAYGLRASGARRSVRTLAGFRRNGSTAPNPRARKRSRS